MKIFISGPMRGLPNYNFDTFDLIEQVLVSAGFDVCNPAHISRSYKESTILNNKAKFDEMVNRQLAELDKCDAILILEGWENSNGVKVELERALQNNCAIFFEKTHLSNLIKLQNAQLI